VKITYFQNTDGGCDFYRAINPVETIGRHGKAKVKKVFSDTMIGFYMSNRRKFDELMDCDVYVTQRVGSISFVKSLRNYIAETGSKAKVVMDFDDNVFCVSPMSAHYKDYGVEEVKFKFPDGSEHWVWKEGNNLDIARNRRMLEEIKDNISSVDMVTTTTEVLADVFREFNPNVRVLPNCVDLRFWKKLPIIRENKDEIRMFWAGGQSHWEDFVLIREPLQELMSKYKNLKLVIMGWVPPGLKEEFGDRIEFHDWVETISYPWAMRSMDVDFGIIPLRVTKFNSCKSPIKWIEMSSLEIPSVCSFLSPYQEMAGLSEKDNGVFIEDNDPTAWINGISFLIDNPDKRIEIAKEARKTVELNFDINTQYHQWVNAYEELLCQSLAPLH